MVATPPHGIEGAAGAGAGGRAEAGTVTHLKNHLTKHTQQLILKNKNKNKKKINE